MGESPVFACKAHVFTIDPRTKKTWLPAGDQAVQVSFFYDRGREQYRIVSLDESAPDAARRMTVNSVLTEKLSFKKTSQKFGQWADTTTGAVYGLGFAAEAELDRFVEQFCQALEHTRRLRRQQQQQQQQQQLTEPAAVGDPLQEGGGGCGSGGGSGGWRGGDTERWAEREGQATRAPGGGGAESDSRVGQLEKQNSALKARIKQLEDAAERAQRQQAEAAQVAMELQRRLQEAGELTARLQQQQQLAAAHRY